MTVKREPRWLIPVLCLVLAAVTGLGASSLVTSSGGGVEVLAIARDVPVGQMLTAADLSVAEVSADSVLTPVPAAQKPSVVGRRVVADLRRGGLLTISQLAPARGLGDDRQQVGVEVRRGQAPVGTLAHGDSILAVTTPDPSDQPADVYTEVAQPQIGAVVVSVSSPDEFGNVVVNLAVAPSDGPLLARRASQGRIVLVREPRSTY
ncbi:SAF domain-containing protein [Streptomyces sp. NPDC001774]